MAAAFDYAQEALRRFHFVNRVVLIADIANSVQLVERDEVGTITRWLDLVATIETQILPSRAGRLVKSLGDGLLIEFGDVRSAVAAALAIHETCRDAEAGQPAERRIQLRIGIEATDLIADARDVYGHGVNLAARLSTLAAPGETVVSATVRDRLTADIDGDVEDLGECFLKNVEQPVHAYRVGPVGSRFNAMPGGRAGALLPTVAVIPFDCEQGDPVTRALGDVLADDVIEALSKSFALNVISRLSTAALRGRALPVIQICDHLKAHYVLSGSYQAGDGRFRLHAELADCRSGMVIWSERFGSTVSEAVGERAAVADEVVARIATAIVLEEVRRARSSPLPTLETHTLLLAAIALMHRNTLPDFSLAHDLLQEIVNRAPRHPIPRSWLAHWQVLRVQQGWSADLNRDRSVALDHAKRALDADPDCALALTVEGLVNTHFLKRLDVAQERYEAAVAADPNCSLAWLLKGTLHAFMDEGATAVEDTQRALSLSPLDPHKYYYDSLSATACLAAQQNERALALAERSLKANRRHTSTLRVKVNALWRLGQLDAARAAAAELRRLEPRLTVSGWLARSPSASYKLGKEFAEILRYVGIPD